MAKSKATGVVYQLKITLRDIKPPVWRRVQVQDCSLAQLHGIIQTCMGWGGGHLHAFEIGGEQFSEPDPDGTTKLCGVGGQGRRLLRPGVMAPTSAAASRSRLMLLFRQHEVHRPAAADVGSWPAKVVEDGLIGAAGVLQSVGQHREAGGVEVAAGEVTLLAGGKGEQDDGGGEP